MAVATKATFRTPTKLRATAPTFVPSNTASPVSTSISLVQIQTTVTSVESTEPTDVADTNAESTGLINPLRWL